MRFGKGFDPKFVGFTILLTCVLLSVPWQPAQAASISVSQAKGPRFHRSGGRKPWDASTQIKNHPLRSGRYLPTGQPVATQTRSLSPTYRQRVASPMWSVVDYEGFVSRRLLKPARLPLGKRSNSQRNVAPGVNGLLVL
jgi:hypothetical protein